MSSNTTLYPQDKAQAGKSYWGVLFNSAAKYSDNPTLQEQQEINSYIINTINRFTCDECISNSHEFIKKHPIDSRNKRALVKWLCELKNNANTHEGKETIDCNTFVSSSLVTETVCETCDAVRKPKPVLALPKVQMPVMDNKYLSVWEFESRYPSFKKAMSYTGTEIQSTTGTVASPVITTTTASPAPTTAELSTRYPSLAQFGLDDPDVPPGPVSEDLNGILKSLDNMYALPASMVGISPSQMNLAYTPEILSNGVSVITQMYLTNAGSMMTSLLASVSLIGISVFAKNSIANYDRLFIQNVAGSLLFHTMNFMNPRIKGDVLPDLKKLFEGLISMDVPKIKEALLFGEKTQGEGQDAKHLIDMMNTKHGLVDMKKMKGGGMRDLRSTTGNGLGSGGGSLTRDEIESMIEGEVTPSSNFDTYSDVRKKYDYVLDNEFL
jgi:hypothetical protein